MVGLIEGAKVLAVGAHPDDIELGCLGTLFKLKATGCRITALVLTRGGDDDGSGRDRAAETRLALRGLAEVVALDFPVGRFGPTNELVGVMDRVLAEERPDLVLSLTEWDSHQDHRAAGAVVRAALRRRPISLVGYQSVSTTPGFPANLLVEIEDVFDQKIAALSWHDSQRGQPYLDEAWLRRWHQDKGATAAGLGLVELFHVYQVFVGGSGVGA